MYVAILLVNAVSVMLPHVIGHIVPPFMPFAW
jgi:hypothetical protein